MVFGDERFPLPDKRPGKAAKWNNVDLDWSQADTVQACIVAPPAGYVSEQQQQQEGQQQQQPEDEQQQQQEEQQQEEQQQEQEDTVGRGEAEYGKDWTVSCGNSPCEPSEDEPAPDPSTAVARYDANANGSIEYCEWLVAMEDYVNKELTTPEIQAIAAARVHTGDTDCQ